MKTLQNSLNESLNESSEYKSTFLNNISNEIIFKDFLSNKYQIELKKLNDDDFEEIPTDDARKIAKSHYENVPVIFWIDYNDSLRGVSVGEEVPAYWYKGNTKSRNSDIDVLWIKTKKTIMIKQEALKKYSKIKK